jgi:hypothetical protein
MKTAFILYGFFRTFDYCKHTLIKHVLEPLDADVFFSTPDTVYTRKKDEVEGLHHCFSRNEDLVDNKIIDCFGSKLKKYEIRQYDSESFKKHIKFLGFPETIQLTNQLSWKVASSLYSFASSMNIFKSYVEETKCHYDLVIITRPDIRWYEDFHPEVVKIDCINCPKFFAIDPSHEQLIHLSDEEKKRIHNRRRQGGAGIHGFNRWINDNILCGNQENMLRLANVYDCIPKYKNAGICFNYETIIGYHMIHNNIPLTDTDFAVYELWRPDRFEW